MFLNIYIGGCGGMNDLTILHLSDLHIDDSSGKYSRLLSSLLNDIKGEIEYVRDNSVIVVVTGDVLHQGPQYAKSKNAYNNTLQFFKDLYEILKTKVVGIYIVPGNHDKFRTSANDFLVSAYRSMKSQFSDKNSDSSVARKFGNDFYDQFWKYHMDTYMSKRGSGYIPLCKEIYKIFGMSESQIKEKTYIKDTFGIDMVEVDGKRYCFVLLNTAWSCNDDSDNRNLILGQFQIDRIKSQFNDLIETGRPDVTIVLGHHPLDALMGEEEDRIFGEMIAFEGLDANVYLCGHTHDRVVNNWVNNRHSLNTFVTGFGWPETSKGQHVGDHYYSMYILNLNANSIDVYVRSTNDSGDFQPDFRIYTNELQNDGKKLVFPIKTQVTQTFIPLHVGDNRSPKAYYISNAFMEYVQKYERNIHTLYANAVKILEDNKNQAYDTFSFEECEDGADEALYNYFFANIMGKEDQIPKEVQTFLKANKQAIFSLFLGFLAELCRIMQNIFVEDMYKEGDIVRFHFRYLADKNKFQYFSLCSSLPDEVDPDEYYVSDIEYGELIERAFLDKTSLIYSVNEEFTNHKLKEKWHNFITVVPLFSENYYKRKNSNVSKKFPYITFGVTTNNEKYDMLLYCMDYFSIKESLEDIIEEYIQLFSINMGEFCEWAKKNAKRGAGK